MLFKKLKLMKTKEKNVSAYDQKQEQLLHFARMGFYIFPIISGGKIPFKGTRGHKDATIDEKIILGWHENNPSCNWAIACGKISGVIVVDIDPRNGGEESIADVVERYGKSVVAPTVKTGGGGYHYYYKYDDYVGLNNGPILDGIDIKTDGGYVLIPPSRTKDDYTWAEGRSLTEVSLPSLPEWIVEAAKSREETDTKVRLVPQRYDSGYKIAKGSRNQTLASFAGVMRNRGASEQTICAALVQHNNDFCDPPLKDEEVRKIAGSVSRYEPGPVVSNSSFPARRSTTGSLSASELMNLNLPEPNWIIPGIIPEGLTILAGKPKAGKSWMVLHLAYAISIGGFALGQIRVDQGKVLYLALEDSVRRLQERLGQMIGDASAPEDLFFETDWKRMDEGGLEDLESWIIQHPSTRLITIDTLAPVRQASRSRSIYNDDYAAIKDIKRLADQYGIGIIIVHHVAKSCC